MSSELIMTENAREPLLYIDMNHPDFHFVEVYWKLRRDQQKHLRRC